MLYVGVFWLSVDVMVNVNEMCVMDDNMLMRNYYFVLSNGDFVSAVATFAYRMMMY